jgi:very-short-patch-repair endonuclease
MNQTNFAKNLRRNMTDAEHRLWYQLRLRQLEGFLFRRQAPMKPYIVDFVCHKAKLVVELDGGQHVENWAHDEKRTVWLNSQGYRVIRFWNNQVMENIDGVVTEIQKHLP